MPLPEPKLRERKKDFIERCISSEIMQRDFGSQQQRYAVCEYQYDKD